MNLASLRFAVLILGLSAVGLAGCVAPKHPISLSPREPVSLPPEVLVTQRAILTAGGQQFALNGYLAQNAAGDRRLIVTEMFGSVLADVLVKHGGAAQVMRSSQLMRPEWITRFVAGDMQCIFGGAPDTDCPVQQLSATHFVIKRRWYKLDLQIVDTKPGPQPPELFDAKPETK